MQDLDDTVLSHKGVIAERIRAQQQEQPNAGQSVPTFYQNLGESLDGRRASHRFFSVVQNTWQTSGHTDFSSCDTLGLSSGAARREVFLAQLANHPDFHLGSSGSRLMDGNYPYLEQLENEIARFHGAEAGLILGSAFEANVAVWTAIPRPGDVIVYDELVHASSQEGFKQSLAIDKVPFRHGNVEAFQSALRSILNSHSLVKQGKRSILVAVESIYSMDGDICPLQELVDAANEVSRGNIQFVVDEAHSLGVMGPRGAGLVCDLGLQSEVAVVVHSCGKALGAVGGIILGSRTIRDAVINYGKSIMYTMAPGFPFAAAIKSGYALLPTGDMQEAEIESLISAIFGWVDETLKLEKEGIGSAETPSEAARQVYSWMASEGLTGFGMM
ncbi:pyridoxal phosphate-dependent transferase [Xylariomycetidae sp. FL2044]|nr:pyridoxal phosphate-dependent transferase [Xylariomycetidae sp. FL2044]